MHLFSPCQWDGGAVWHNVESYAKRKRRFSRASDKSFMSMRKKNGPLTLLEGTPSSIGGGEEKDAF